MVGFEPTSLLLTVRCFAIKLHQNMVGIAGFEPTASCTQNKHSDQTELYTEKHTKRKVERPSFALTIKMLR